MDGFDWDEWNSDKNLIKHNVTVQESEEIFANKPLRTLEDGAHSQLEDRYKALGITDNGRKLHVTFTLRENKIRIISARDMSKKERKLYEESY